MIQSVCPSVPQAPEETGAGTRTTSSILLLTMGGPSPTSCSLYPAAETERICVADTERGSMWVTVGPWFDVPEGEAGREGPASPPAVPAED